MTYTPDLDNTDPVTQMPSSDGDLARPQLVDTDPANQPSSSGMAQARPEYPGSDLANQSPPSEDNEARLKLVDTTSADPLPPSGDVRARRMASFEDVRRELERIGGIAEEKISMIIEGLVKSATFRIFVVNSPFSMFSTPPRSMPYSAPSFAALPRIIVKDKLFTTPPPRQLKTPRAPGRNGTDTTPPAPKRRKTSTSKPVSDLEIRLDNLENTMQDLNASFHNFSRQAEAQPTEPSTSANGSCRLLSLPGELRNRIYRFAIVGTRTIEIDIARWSTHQPELLKTCKQVRQEALRLFYMENKISTNIHDWNPILKYHFQQLMIAHDIRPLHLHHYFSGGPNWKNLMDWLRGVHEGRIGAISDAVGKQRGIERKTVGIMFRVVRKATGVSTWPQVEDLLVAHRELLGMNDARWLA